MLEYLSTLLTDSFGPFRLLGYHSFLILLGIYGGFFLTYILLPRYFKRLPVDRGREFAVENKKAVGKPTGAGIVFIIIFAFIAFLVTPFGLKPLLIIGLTVLTALSGYLDDRSAKPWSEYTKGLLDLILSAAGALVMCLGRDVSIWLPFTTQLITVPVWIFIPAATLLIWLSINTTNCSDGVDGLSGTLIMLALITLGVVMYFVLGHADISAYLLLPHNPDGAKWAILCFCLVGTLAAYLWFNAFPSSVLMGDAGSRALGFFVGALVIATGNPFILFIISSVLLVNGGTGLVKVALLRFMKIRIFHNTRFPLHDHVRENKRWSNAQVLLKFAIIQVLISVGLLGIFFKVR